MENEYEHTIIGIPTYLWQMKIGNMSIPVEKGREPNRFYRFMQTLILGIKWEKF
jgi:hypothetical protein